MSLVTDGTSVCGVLGCHEPAAAVIDHPDHGERAVCHDHADDYPVLREVTE